MAETTYQYSKAINSDRLTMEISACSDITIVLKGINTAGASTVHLTFRAELSPAEKTVLDALVDAHIPTPPENQEVVLTKIYEEPLYATTIDRTYQMQSFEKDIPATVGTYDLDISFPFAIILLGGDFAVRAENIGDSCKFVVAPNTIVGTITDTVASGSTNIPVSETAYENIYRGYNVKLMAGQTVQSLGYATDFVGSIVTVSQATTSAFSPATPTYVVTEFEVIPNFYFSTTPRLIEIGKNTFNGTYIPANTIMRFIYNNVTGTEKKISFAMEYYF